MNVLVDDGNLTAIANAIRTKNGTQDTYKPSQMAEAISEISGGGDWITEYAKTKTTEYSYFFAYCDNFETIDVTVLDTSNVINMSSMFSYCSSLTTLDVSSFNTSKMTSLTNFANGCKVLTYLKMFDTSKVRYWSNAFTYCVKLETIDGILDMQSGTTILSMFGSSKANCCVLLTNVNIKNLNATGLNLTYCTALSHDSLMYLINNLVTTTSAKTLTLGSTNQAKLTSEEIAIATSKGWTIA